MLAGVSKGRVMKTKTHNLMSIIIKEKQNYFGWSETAHISVLGQRESCQDRVHRGVRKKIANSDLGQEISDKSVHNVQSLYYADMSCNC